MGGHDAGTQHQFTGIAKYFNSYTITGRRNVSCVYKLYSCLEILCFYVFLTTSISILFFLSVCFGHICQPSSHRPFLQIEA
uniref:Uncharacterized protein n=1 Tax=Amphilophus citrinellus TaxID=61819 RepID=A0A3Q0R7Z6_AMPCI